MSNKRNALGRGLSALLEDKNTDITSGINTTMLGAVNEIPVTQIETNPFQPRDFYDENSLKELSASIKIHGIIQPITVRKLGYDQFQLISGERRLRAAKMALLEKIPAYIRIANDQQMLEMALVENIHRENLNAIEISISYRRLIEECNITQEQLSERMGKDRTTISNYIRLLKLPPEIQLGIKEKKISMGHARALINIEDAELQLAIYHETITKELSVRSVEQLAASYNNKEKKFIKASKPISADIKSIQDKLSSYFETKVHVNPKNNGKGNIIIEYYSDNDFNRILEQFGKF